MSVDTAPHELRESRSLASSGYLQKFGSRPAPLGISALHFVIFPLAPPGGFLFLTPQNVPPVGLRRKAYVVWLTLGAYGQMPYPEGMTHDQDRQGADGGNPTSELEQALRDSVTAIADCEARLREAIDHQRALVVAARAQGMTQIHVAALTGHSSREWVRRIEREAGL
jgi:hypothetical protein